MVKTHQAIILKKEKEKKTLVGILLLFKKNQ